MELSMLDPRALPFTVNLHLIFIFMSALIPVTIPTTRPMSYRKSWKTVVHGVQPNLGLSHIWPNRAADSAKAGIFKRAIP